MPVPSLWMNYCSRIARIIGLLALATLLAGCSAIKLAYNNLDDIAYWWMDSYVDFNDEQSPRVRADLARIHRWHRQQELPQLASLLKSIEQLTPADISASQVCAFEPRVRERVAAVTSYGEPQVVSLALSLAPEQLAHLERKFDRTNSDYSKEWLRIDATSMRDKRFEKMLERAEMVYGSLDDRQKAVLRAEIDRSVFDPRRAFDEQRRRQQDLLLALRQIQSQRMDATQASTVLRAYLQRSQESPDPAYRAVQLALIQETCGMTATLHNSTTAAQRDIAIRRLRAWQRDLKELNGKP
ncbi:DUF6279 family lipoprotein [Caenimonas koreensis]|nr:DUF6279 family lipoprotein [Caenimonas koreensis]